MIELFHWFIKRIKELKYRTCGAEFLEFSKLYEHFLVDQR